MRILVLGSSGMLGSTTYQYLVTKGHDVLGVSRRSVEGINSVEIDVWTQFNKLEKFILKDRPEVVINCIGVLVRESNEYPTKAIYLPSQFPFHTTRA